MKLDIDTSDWAEDLLDVIGKISRKGNPPSRMKQKIEAAKLAAIKVIEYYNKWEYEGKLSEMNADNPVMLLPKIGKKRRIELKAGSLANNELEVAFLNGTFSGRYEDDGPKYRGYGRLEYLGLTTVKKQRNR